MPPMPETLTLDRLEKRFGTAPPAVAALSLTVGAGEMLGLLGPSGCGKTTVLRMIAGLAAATSGRILVGGRDITRQPAHGRGMGLVFQNYALFPHMSAAANIAFGLQMRRLSARDIRDRTRRALDLVRLGPLAERRPKQLSGGQQQRVALARALVIEPNVLLLDEPLSNLDATLRADMLAEIRDLQRRLGITAVFVTHDQSEALAVCDRIAVLRGGRLEQVGTPREIHDRPASRFVAGFVGRVNQLPAHRAADGSLSVHGHALPGDSADGRAGTVQLLVRPHHIRLDAPATAVPDGDRLRVGGVLRDRIFLGDRTTLTVMVGPTPVSVEWQGSDPPAALAPGDPVALSWRRTDMSVFPEDDPP
ncbi:putative spermidine/putrescine transport system ATP-binding protein [Azospirillum agricola]|uniref:ABC transporter ATP-binding protein n=1 Tax=Azospirillum agricola TaxID=1720247 RepID=UPI001F3595A3|nr:ABC transporter ATP-binding protein [Azospirillum agricola]MBP2231910.1 putative spermidine/putrescine transport system ATP-binding protein [Azospirillum agricola]